MVNCQALAHAGGEQANRHFWKVITTREPSLLLTQHGVYRRFITSKTRESLSLALKGAHSYRGEECSVMQFNAKPTSRSTCRSLACSSFDSVLVYYTVRWEACLKLHTFNGVRHRECASQGVCRSTGSVPSPAGARSRMQLSQLLCVLHPRCRHPEGPCQVFCNRRAGTTIVIHTSLHCIGMKTCRLLARGGQVSSNKEHRCC